VVERLVVYPENMARNLEHLGGLVHSQRVLLALTQKGLSREDAYAAVQRNAMKVWRREGAFLDFLKADPEVAGALSDAELADLFEPTWHFSQVDTIFRRVFGDEAVARAEAAE
jgi:adenylosuccinate lyase